jgi:hypothetical protein
MASYNGEPCAVTVVDENSLRVLVGDVSFLFDVATCEIMGRWFASTVELISADGVLALKRSEFAALKLRDHSSDLFRSILIWVAAGAGFVAVLVLGVRLAAGPLSHAISLQTEAKWFPFTATDNEKLKTLLREIPGTSGLHIALDDDAEDVNAFALPGGSIRVTKGLVCFAKSPDELIGVIGHEVGHIQRRHVMRSLITSLGTRFLLVALAGGGGATSFTESMISREFSISDEREADEYSARLLVEAGLAPRALGDFFERMGKEKPMMLEAILSDHPTTAARVAYFRGYKTHPTEIDKRAGLARETAWHELRTASCEPTPAPQAQPRSGSNSEVKFSR